MKDDYIVKEEVYRGHTIKVGFDIYVDEHDDPRLWDGNLTTMAYFHNRYVLGDEGHGYHIEDYDSWNEMELDIIRNEKIVAMQPVYMYDHSGITISTRIERYWQHARWDSGQIGFVYITRNSVMQVMNWKRISKKRRQWLIDQLSVEVEIYDKYLRKELYAVEIYDHDKDGEPFLIDAYGGIFDRPDEIVKLAKADIDHYN